MLVVSDTSALSNLAIIGRLELLREPLGQVLARAKPADLQEILDSLVTLGRAHRSGEKFSV